MTYLPKMTAGSQKAFGVTSVRILQAALAFLAMLWMAMPVNAQHTQGKNNSAFVEEQERPVADSHSFMELFTKLENQWMQAMQGKDRSGLETLLAPEFMVYDAEDPGHPMVRDAWISDALAGPRIGSFSHNTMAIRAFMGVAIVSFMQKEEQKVNGKDRTVQCFVVDIWEVNHQHWQVAERYISPVGNRLQEDRHAGNRTR